jgi:hypothetical protein
VTRRTFQVIVGLLCVVGLWLRLRGLGFGLPAVYNMDEVAIMNRAMAFGTGDLNPRNFVYPTFYFYALFAWEGLTFLAGLTAGWWDSLAAFQREFFVDPSRLYWSGRLLSALCGTATIAAVAALGSRLFGRTAGVVAAATLAAMPVAVMDAHYVKHDVPVTLLIVLVHLVLARMLVAATPIARRHIWLAGAVTGLAVSTHYYAVFTTLPVAAILLTQPGLTAGQRLRDAGWAAAAAAIVFVSSSPFLVLNFGTALRDISQNQQIVMSRATDAIGAFGFLGRYLTMLIESGAGWTGLVIFVAGLLIAWRQPRTGFFLTIFPLAFLLFISNTVPATRYLNPLLPFVAIAAGIVVTAIMRQIAARTWAVGLAIVFTLATTPDGLEKSIRLGTFFRQADTRTLAQRWIEANVPAGESVLVQPYSVPLRQSRDGLIEALRATLGSEDRATVRFQQQLALSPYPSPAYRTIFLGDGGLDKDKIYVSLRAFDGHGTLAPLRDLGVKYVVLKRYNESDPSLASLDRALAGGAHLVAMFSPYRPAADAGQRSAVAPFLHNTDARMHDVLERPGPIIEVWRVD